jgi:hypothetical protein
VNKIKYLIYFLIITFGITAYKVYTSYEALTIAEIKKFSANNLKLNVDLKGIVINSLFPLTIKITDLNVKKEPELNLIAQKLEIQLLNPFELIKMKSKKPALALRLSDFKISYSQTELHENTNTPVTQSNIQIKSAEQLLPKNKYIQDVNVSLLLEQGLIELQKNRETIISSKIKKMELNLPSLKSDIKLSYDGSIKLQADILKLDYPLVLESKINLTDGWLNASETKLSFVGIDCNLGLKYHLQKKYIDLTNKIDISNLNRLPLNLIENFPISKLLGALKSEIKITGYLDNNPLIAGFLDLKIFSADLSLKKADIASSGSLKLNLTTSFSYVKKLSLNAIKWDADLSKLYFEKTNFIKKPISVKLLTAGSGNFNEEFKLDSFSFHFDKFSMTAQGLLSQTKFSNFKFNIPAFNLTGFEKYLLFLPQYPLNGSVEAKGQIEGNLNDPKNLSIMLDPFKINNFKYTLYKKINDVEIEGPIQANISGSISVKNQIAEKGDIKGFVDAVNLDIRKNGESLKVSDDPLKMEFRTAVLNKTIYIEKFDIKSMFGHFDIKGNPPLSLADDFKFNLNLYSLNWNRIRNFLPKNELINNIKSIAGKGSVDIQGKLNPKELLNSDIKVNSKTNFTISEMKIPWDLKISQNSNEASTNIKNTEIIPDAFVSNKKLLNSFIINNELKIDKVILSDNQIIDNIFIITSIKNESLFVSGSIQSFFEGQLAIDNIEVPLSTKDPKTKYQVSSNKINLSKMISTFMPQYNDLIKGLASFKSEGSSYLPYSVNFKKGLFAKGMFNYENGRVDTFNFANLIKEKLLSLPNISTPKLLEKYPLEGSISSLFSLKELTVQLEKFKAKTNRNEEIELNGTISANLDTDMKAVLKLVDLPLKGDFINANKDNTGRIEFPIEIKGNLKNPQWSFMGNTLEKMTNNYITFEKNKLFNIAQKEVDKKTNEANRAIQSEVNKQKKKLEYEAKKALDGLFK